MALLNRKKKTVPLTTLLATKADTLAAAKVKHQDAANYYQNAALDAQSDAATAAKHETAVTKALNILDGAGVTV